MYLKICQSFPIIFLRLAPQIQRKKRRVAVDFTQILLTPYNHSLKKAKIRQVG